MDDNFQIMGLIGLKSENDYIICNGEGFIKNIG